MDAFLDKHPPHIMNIRIQMDMIQGLWLEHVMEESEKGELVDDLDPSHDIDEFLQSVRTWLKEKWEFYVKSQHGPGRRFPPGPHLDLHFWHYPDGLRLAGFYECAREYCVMRAMQQMFGA